MSINLFAVLVATVAQFVVGAVWYMPLFGNVWGKIHGFEKYSKKEQAEMQKSMMPWMVVQFILGGLSAFYVAMFASILPEYSVYTLAFWAWIGFIVPTQASAVIFGGTAPKWMSTKIAVMAGGALACMMVTAFVISFMQ